MLLPVNGLRKSYVAAEACMTSRVPICYHPFSLKKDLVRCKGEKDKVDFCALFSCYINLHVVLPKLLPFWFYGNLLFT